MKEITKEEYENYKDGWEGIIVSIPKNSLQYNAELYIYGFDLTGNEPHFHRFSYNMEDGCVNGFSGCDLQRFYYLFTNLEDFTWYQFDNLTEFCEWYLHKENKEEDSKNLYGKEWITEKCGTNTPPPTPPQSPPTENKPNTLYRGDDIRDIVNPGWNTRRAQLKDILTLLEYRDIKQNTLQMLQENIPQYKRNYLLKQLERDEKRIENFLDEKIYIS